MIELKYWKEHY